AEITCIIIFPVGLVRSMPANAKQCTHSGIVRARGAGKRFGRPPVLNEEQKQVVFERIKSGVSISAIAREFKTSRQTILRAKAKLQTPDI
ncbi:helix-turn-helix domain-containing protein, partial [Escherichia sp. SS-MK2]